MTAKEFTIVCNLDTDTAELRVGKTTFKITDRSQMVELSDVIESTAWQALIDSGEFDEETNTPDDVWQLFDELIHVDEEESGLHTDSEDFADEDEIEHG